jgi:hypothetical protein
MKMSKYFIVLIAIVFFCFVTTTTLAVIYSAESSAFLTGTFLTTPLWEYLVINWVGTGILELVIGVYIVLYMAPKGVDKMVSQAIKEAKNSPEIAPLMDKVKEIIAVMEPAMKQIANAVKNIDIEKTQKDLQPILDALKKVNPDDINGALKALKDITGTVNEAIKKPSIPEPDQEEKEVST